MKKITDYQVHDHGVDNSQYFQGHGLAYTDWQDTATGCGDTYNEAFEDACEQLAQGDWETESILNDEKDNPRAELSCHTLLGLDDPSNCSNKLPAQEECEGCEECSLNEDVYYFVSIDVQ